MSGQVVNLADARDRRERRLGRESEPMVSKQALAKHFDVSVRTVERWVQKGCPVAQRLWGSGAPRFFISAVIEWHAAGVG